jgi:pimeloyl-ACP methyl ester carboxylesterase
MLRAVHAAATAAACRTTASLSSSFHLTCFTAAISPQGGWRNMGRARLVLEMARYRPILSIPNIKVPILFISATKDRLCRPEDVAAAAAIAQHPTEVTIDANHFEIYRGKFLQQAMDAMVRHVWRCVGGSRQHPSEHEGAAGAEPDEDEQQEEAGGLTSHEGEL